MIEGALRLKVQCIQLNYFTTFALKVSHTTEGQIH
jgi:hypothetical protein